ncbi:MAG: N-acetylmuramoyl-L-alanine amidase [Hoeflea sp.]|uniref:N-acetylmuramoyl-L-alanine amidase n=1 Tax=Hoeflea sp. TaxID=1940281 RepID=UPI001E15310F|nr:N-acetylmuramoyl-L-alanine amidase [Hoeflea sp.]MBU4529984.1 N-acetylmuramoyl-L-alanine amidase [Alphaproteobacteria bacterium]MBU4543211.1 N-acetylmuramoyl-L-alanine amidase [Alphaproteobacteria bacterium]MBU4550249.1 N-acetylmuramoyl-L-alanine amidase [Alphaproteobacteria bacterium]MBV1722477.1 N-acetylmuramoyl-L-alanine amidase [Hoeflea sp.]MBV1761627.1 N-acetylmuramoyl-L-alanine amidase [Hoeflea sp.]
MSDFQPDFAPAGVCPSPNHGARRNGRTPDMLILHYTGMPSAEAALQWLCAEESQVSSHYFVDEEGRITQLVPESQRAWHAGQGHWKGDTDINSASIGIEIANPGHAGGSPPFHEAQIEAVIRLCCDIVQRHAIAAERVLAHSDIAPMRKQDPGECFPWDRLHREGVGHWVEPVPVGGGRFFQEGDTGQPVEALQSMLALYGYGVRVDGSYDAETSAVIRAFQRHFRPERVDGVADASTIGTLHKLLSALATVA